MSGRAVELRPARAADAAAAAKLLAAAGLPAELEPAWFPASTVVATRGEEIIGMAAYERAGMHALLRSIVVAPAARGTGVGRRLVADRLDRLARAGCVDVHLLTTGAAGYFARLGFAATPRDDVPEPLRRLSQFASLCPASATCMRLERPPRAA